jgi:hypothetical protein
MSAPAVKPVPLNDAVPAVKSETKEKTSSNTGKTALFTIYLRSLQPNSGEHKKPVPTEENTPSSAPDGKPRDRSPRLHDATRQSISAPAVKSVPLSNAVPAVKSETNENTCGNTGKPALVTIYLR